MPGVLIENLSLPRASGVFRPWPSGCELGEEFTDLGEVVDGAEEAGSPDNVSRDGVGEGVAGETEEAFGGGEIHLEGGGHGEDGVLGGVAVGMGYDLGIGGAADPGSDVESDGIAAVHVADRP